MNILQGGTFSEDEPSDEGVRWADDEMLSDDRESNDKFLQNSLMQDNEYSSEDFEPEPEVEPDDDHRTDTSNSHTAV